MLLYLKLNARSCHVPDLSYYNVINCYVTDFILDCVNYLSFICKLGLAFFVLFYIFLQHNIIIIILNFGIFY